MRRFFLAVVLVLGLAPGSCPQLPPPLRGDVSQRLSMTALPLTVHRAGQVEIRGAWRLRSSNWRFGGFSALQSLGGGILLAVSDSGRMMRFAEPGAAPRLPVFADLSLGKTAFDDIESLARDPATGTIWAAYEHQNMIERYDADFHLRARIHPPAMRDWSPNSGPEAMVRLADGRFIVLAEAAPEEFAADSPGLLFPADPIGGAPPLQFRFLAPDGYRPVDLTLLPDGRVLILLRTMKWRLPPAFAAKIMLADPRTIRPGQRWTGEIIADLAPPVPVDNYEGLTVEPQADGSIVLWLISDDNQMPYQRTLLLKLVWRPNEKAHGTSRAPS